MTTAATASKQPPLIRRWLRGFACGTGALCLLGLLLRLTVRDRVPYLATAFYALPLPVLAVLAVVTTIVLSRLRQTVAARCWLLIATGTLLWCVRATCEWSSADSGEGASIRILCWNTCRGTLGWNRVAAEINKCQPDVAGLVEAGNWSEQRRTFWQQSCPGYHVSMLGGGFVCLTKEPAGDGVAVDLPGDGQYRQLEVSADGHSLTLLIVDLTSDPLQSREATLRQLSDDADRLNDRPVVILGDFNTPAESVHFAPLRREYRQAFETAGAGYKATWPLPVPVLCLDHIWANGHVHIDRCEHGWTTASDHRPVVAEVTVLR